jgi:predicted O-methyltransferase YrrM
MTDNINYEHIVEYLNQTLPKSDGLLGELEDYAQQHLTPIIQKEVRCLLDCILTYKKPETILEVGTAIGYSAIFFAEHVGENGKVITLEKDPDYIERAKSNIAKSHVSDKITLIEGDAVETIMNIEGSFDVVFLDANKSKYRHYFDVIFPKIKDGGLLICDNILYKGMVSNDELLPRKHNTIVRALRDFLPFLSNHPMLTTSIIPIGDGVTISVKKCDTEEKI